MKTWIQVGMVVSLFTLSATALALGKHQPGEPLDTVASVDLNRYVGVWYEIARLPQSFEKNCVGVTAEYQLRDDGKITVLNNCRKYTLDGKLKVARGTAKVVDEETNAKLKVTFFWPFSGDYWILELGSNYEYSVVGSPNRKYFWILSRSAHMDDQQINAIIERFAAKGFDLSTLYRTPQALN